MVNRKAFQNLQPTFIWLNPTHPSPVCLITVSSFSAMFASLSTSSEVNMMPDQSKGLTQGGCGGRKKKNCDPYTFMFYLITIPESVRPCPFVYFNPSLHSLRSIPSSSFFSFAYQEMPFHLIYTTASQSWLTCSGRWVII